MSIGSGGSRRKLPTVNKRTTPLHQTAPASMHARNHKHIYYIPAPYCWTSFRSSEWMNEVCILIDIGMRKHCVLPHPPARACVYLLFLGILLSCQSPPLSRLPPSHRGSDLHPPRCVCTLYWLVVIVKKITARERRLIVAESHTHRPRPTNIRVNQIKPQPTSQSSGYTACLL